MSRVLKVALYSGLACGVLIIVAVVTINRSAIVQRMDNWRLLPRKETLTELYFENTRDLPTVAKPTTLQELKFVTHNLERARTKYKYRIIASSLETSVKQQLAIGDFELAHNGYKTTVQQIKIPAIGARVSVKVVLDYMGTSFENDQPTLQSQAIDFWTYASKDGAAHAKS